MRRGSVGRGAFAAAAVTLAALLAGCGPRLGGPAPLVSGEAAAPPPMTLTVQHGQTLSGIAQTYHVPMLALAEANHLYPPYRIVAGGTLIVPESGPLGSGPTGPGSMGPGVVAGNVPAAGPPALAPEPPSAPVAVAELPPPRPAAARPPPTEPSPATLSPPRPEAAAGPSLPKAKPEREIPLDQAPPAGAEEPAVTAAQPPAGTTGAAPPTRGKSAAEAPIASAAPPAHGGGTFLWPVHGHILEGYGSGPDGTHNDGINIAAPRGAAVQAADAGVVAYAGNELRGYGNLILVKHANGWITAYAHCDLMLVKPGEKVARGQVIARVGSTGNVGEPQLHFELRRGDKAVDPRTYLAPLPTAAATSSRAG